MDDLWRTLKIGDTVRIVAWPKELDEGCLHLETRALYEWLVETGSILTIVEIDSFGLPYGEIVRVVDGVEFWETIILNHSQVSVVRRAV